MKPVVEAYPKATGQKLVECLIHEYVLSQLSNLTTHARIPGRLLSEDLKLYGWVVDYESTRISSFDPISSSFKKL